MFNVWAIGDTGTSFKWWSSFEFLQCVWWQCVLQYQTNVLPSSSGMAALVWVDIERRVSFILDTFQGWFSYIHLVTFVSEFEGIWPITPTEGGRRDRTVLNCWELQIPKIAIFRVSTGGTREGSADSGQWYASLMSAKFIFLQETSPWFSMDNAVQSCTWQRILHYKTKWESVLRSHVPVSPYPGYYDVISGLSALSVHQLHTFLMKWKHLVSRGRDKDVIQDYSKWLSGF